MAAIRYTLTHSNGRAIAAGRTEKQAVSLASANGSDITIIGTDGVSYMSNGRRLSPVGYVAPAMSAEQSARYLAAHESQMTRAMAARKAPASVGYDDDAAIEDLGLGTADGGLFGRR